MHACGYTEKPKSKEQLREMFSWISPLFVARTQVEIVDNVSEVEVVCLPEHRCVRLFSIWILPVLSASISAKCSLIRFRSKRPQLKTENRHLIAPFTAAHRCLPVNKWISSGMNSSLTAARMVFPSLSNSLKSFRISYFEFASQICVGSRSSVSATLTETGTWAFVIRGWCNGFVFNNNNIIIMIKNSFFFVLSWYDSK